MTQEQIEKAADKYAEAHDVEPYDEYGSGIRIGARFGFIAGAKWRINSVWHKPNEEPIHFCNLLLIEYNDGELELDCRFDAARIRRWAYVKDLLPTE